jgi:O-antigen ligase
MRNLPGSRKIRRSWFARSAAALTSYRARFIVLASFMGLVALTGGSSRPDVQSLILLRPVAVLFCIYAVLIVNREQLHAVMAPLAMVLALMALALLQLIPLPVVLWRGLPHGDLVARASTLAGVGTPQRPLSLDPSRTWNSLFALFVPLATICLVAIQGPTFRRRVIPSICAVALLSAAFGLFQAVGGEKLHLYTITHENYPVGLFANKNHQAIMLLWLMLAGSWLAARSDPERHSPAAAVGGAIGLILVLFALVILTGSRAGLALSGPALAFSGALLLRAPATKTLMRRAGAKKNLLAGGAIVAIALPLVFVFGVLLASSRETALSRLFSKDPSDDLRWSILPIALHMARDFLPFGSGLGSFEKVFNLYEPSGMLMSHYVNQAHDDFVQIVVEGGVPGLVLIFVGLLWLIRSLWQMGRSSRPDRRTFAIFYGGSMALWLAASLVDYPLRTPLAAMLIAALTAKICVPSVGGRSEPNIPDTRGARRQHAPSTV